MFFSLLKRKIPRAKYLQSGGLAPTAENSTLLDDETGQIRSAFENTNAPSNWQRPQRKRIRGETAAHSQHESSPSSPYKPKKTQSDPPTSEKRSLPWNDITQMLGHESTTALSNSINEITTICEENPSIAGQLKPVLEQLKQARRTALITLQFVRSRTVAEYETGFVSLRQVVMEVLNNRAKWLEKRNIKVSVGPLDEKLVANITALFLLVDELVSWAGKLAPEIIIAITPGKLSQSGIQLQVFAKVARGHAPDVDWTNVGWYLWHKLATAVGGSAELNVMDQALCVCVSFTPITPRKTLPEISYAPDPQDSIALQPANTDNKTTKHANAHARSKKNVFSTFDSEHAASVRELSHDRDIAAIVQGCHVQLIMTDDAVKRQAIQAMSGLGLFISHAKNVEEAMRNSSVAQIPHAVVYQSNTNISEMLQLRLDWSKTRATAYIEISDHEVDSSGHDKDADFHFSSIGTMSTAHVTSHAISESLAPALLFELCKVL